MRNTLWIGPAETVDRLLEVAHKEQLAVKVIVVAQRLDQTRPANGSVSWNSSTSSRRICDGQPLAQAVPLGPDKQRPGTDQQIVEIQHAEFPFLAVVLLGHVGGQGHRLQGRFGGGQGRGGGSKCIRSLTPSIISRRALAASRNRSYTSSLTQCFLPAPWTIAASRMAASKACGAGCGAGVPPALSCAGETPAPQSQSLGSCSTRKSHRSRMVGCDGG